MDTLALYIYPLPHGTRYGRIDLSNRPQVITVFDYCQILLGVISKEGWDFLVNYYGYKELFQINQESDWFDCASVEEFISCVEAERESAPDQL